APKEPVELSPGRPAADDASITVHVEHGRISGHVVDSRGQPVADAAVQVRAKGNNASWSFVGSAAVTGTNGRFAIDDRPVGDYELRTSLRGGGAVVTPSVHTDGGDVEVVLNATGALEGTLVGFRAPVQVLVYATSALDRPRRALVEDDRFHLADLEPGDH